ncbi:hypothetical protein [Sorangium sp. So ce131]|uniref:hypothetical protein n=1 Tax=Sorangium sp. So ce131 TaxID=3133282 RepID=UPI003F638E7A
MRGRTSSLVCVICVAAAAAFTACSDDTPENPGGGGGNGGGGTTSGTTSGASTTTSAATTTSSSASGGGGGGGGGGETVCDQACTKAAECDVPICSLVPYDCSDPAAECAAECVNGASCEQIQTLTGENVDPELAGCLSACQGGEGGGSGSGTQCLSCAAQNGCMTACALNATCRVWLECARTCMESDPQPECFTACNEAHPDAQSRYEAVYECTCTSCEASCGAVADPCAQPGGM